MDIKEAIDFVLDQAVIHDDASSLFLNQDNEEEHKKHFNLKQNFVSLHTLLHDVEKKLALRTSKLNLMPSELKGLPQELIDQFSNDELETRIMRIMEDYGGTISLDRLILEWYQRHNEIMKRRSLTAKLYRMMKSGLVFSMPAKGVYTLNDSKQKNKPILESDSENNNDLLE